VCVFPLQTRARQHFDRLTQATGGGVEDELREAQVNVRKAERDVELWRAKVMDLKKKVRSRRRGGFRIGEVGDTRSVCRVIARPGEFVDSMITSPR
jgi:hypothetical protein